MGGARGPENAFRDAMGARYDTKVWLRPKRETYNLVSSVYISGGRSVYGEEEVWQIPILSWWKE